MIYEYALTPALSVSFQRYPYPASGSVTGLARSWGALPLLSGDPGRLVLPCPAGEAFWIGLVATGTDPLPRLGVHVVTATGDRLDALTGGAAPDSGDLAAAPPHGLPGIARPDGTWWVFTRDPADPQVPACREIGLRAPGAQVWVAVVGPDEFLARGGAAVPALDESQPYGGWRLP